VLYGHASEHHNQRPLHAGNTTLRRLPCHQHTGVVNVDEVHVDGALCLPKYADRRIQRRTANTVSINFLYNRDLSKKLTKPL
jgi:hypothetical protein